MAKLTLTDITTSFLSKEAINSNNTLIEQAIENTLSRDGTTPNEMGADLDMDSNDIINVNSLTVDSITLNGVDITSLTTAADAAAASEAAASASESAAAASEAAAAAAAAAAILAAEDVPDWKGDWLTSTVYDVGDLVKESGNVYICLVDHTSSTFATDLSNTYWELFVPKGDTGSGSGDVVAANNGTEFNAATFRSNLDIPYGPSSFLGGAGAPMSVLLTPAAVNFQKCDISGPPDAFTGYGTGDANLVQSWTYDSNTALQVAYLVDATPSIFMRSKTSGSFNSWLKVPTEDEVDTIVSDFLLAIGISDLPSALIVTEADGISSNDNDTTIPTSAAVKDFVDTSIAAINLDGFTEDGPDAANTGTTVAFSGLSDANWIEVHLKDISQDASVPMLIQLSVSTSFVTSGYDSHSIQNGTGGNAYTNKSTGFVVNTQNAAYTSSGMYRLTRMPGTNFWSGQGLINRGGTNLILTCVGNIELAGAVDGVRLITESGNLDGSGTIAIRWG